MNDVVASKIIDAYRASPLLGALFMLNVLTFAGFGLYLWDKEGKTARYVLQMQADMKELRLEAMRVASECGQQHAQQLFTPPPEQQRRRK